MKTKIYFLLTIFLLSYGISMSQNLKDYFIPAGDKNLSIYSWMGSDAFKVKIWFVAISDSVYRVDQVIMFQDQISNGESRTVTISKNSITVSNVVYFNNVINDEGEKKHNPPTTLLKMPAKGQTSSWSFTPINATTKCKAEWTTVTIDGVSKKAIKVTNTPFEGGKLLTTGITYDYYVEGIGYWKRKVQDGKDFQVLEKQEYDATYKSY